MTQFAALPQVNQQISARGQTSTAWYRFFADVFAGRPPQAESSVTAGASPFTYTALRKGFLIVQGGTVSLVQWSRGGVTNHATGQTQGMFPLSQADSLVITYSGAPTLTFVPQ